MNKQHARSKMKMIILTVLAIFVIAILMAGLLFRQAFPAAPRFKDLPVSGDSTVSTDSGLIRGAHQDGVYRYLGVPYAHANKRFMDGTDKTLERRVYRKRIWPHLTSGIDARHECGNRHQRNQ